MYQIKGVDIMNKKIVLNNSELKAIKGGSPSGIDGIKSATSVVGDFVNAVKDYFSKS